MGVKGLWRLLLPIGRRISLETLEGKILAIDASIWLTQFLKALRDPHTGKSQPAGHLIGFIRRLCRLYFHGIRPVLVFDGATPEIKQREIENRRRRREKFSSTTTSHQQRARRLLTEQLQKRKLSASALKGAAKVAKKTLDKNAPGFHPGAQAASNKLKDPPRPIDDDGESKKSSSKAALEDEAAILAAIREDLEAEEKEKKQANSANDWDDVVLIEETEKAVAVGNQNNVAEDDPVEYEDFGLKQAKLRFKKQIDVEYIASLPSDQRKDAIEQAKKQQRLQSRRDFMPAAGDMDQFSSVQVTNFLKSSRLNLNLQKMAKAEVQRNNQYGGDLMASDRTTRISLIRENQHDKKTETKEGSEDEAMEDDSLFRKRSTKRKKLFTISKSSSSDDEENEIEWEDGGKPHSAARTVGGRRFLVDDESDQESELLSQKKQKTSSPVAAQRKEVGASSAGVPFSDDFEGGGFLPASEANGVGDFVSSGGEPAQTKSPSDGMVGSDGGFILSSNTDKKRDMIYLEDDVSSCEGDDSGGGFLANGSKTSTQNHVETIEIKDDDSLDPVTISTDQPRPNTANDARLAREMEDAFFARALQRDDDVEESTTKAASVRTALTVDVESSDDDIDWEDGNVETTVSITQDSSVETLSFGITDDGEKQKRDSDIQCVNEGTKKSRTAGLLSTGSDDEVELLGNQRNADDESRVSADGSVLNARQGWNQRQQRIDQGSQVEFAEVSIDRKEKSRLGSNNEEETSEEHPVRTAVNRSKQRYESEAGAMVKQVLQVDKVSEDNKNSKRVSEVNEWGNAEGATSPSKEQGCAGKTSGSDQSSDGGEPDQRSAAFARAEATASNLAGWAGRAFRRAMKESGRFDQPEGKQEVSEDSVSLQATTGNSRQTSNPPNATQGSSVPRRHAPSSVYDTVQAKANTSARLKEYEEQWTRERRQQERDTDTVTDEMKQEVMTLLRLFGVPYIESPAEAEAQCAALEQLGLVDGIVTEDSDVFIFGGRKIYKNIFDEKLYAEAYMAEDAEREMEINRNGMVALAMLLGSDYTEGVRGVGIVNAMEILRAFDVTKDLKDGLTGFRKWLDGFDPSDRLSEPSSGDEVTALKAFHAQHRSARSRWEAPEHFPADNIISAYTRPAVDMNADKFSWGSPDIEGLVEFCSRHIGWSEQETRRLLEPVAKRSQSGERYRQTRLDSFMRYDDGIKFAHIKSKRLREVLGLEEDEESPSKTPAGEKSCYNN